MLSFSHESFFFVHVGWYCPEGTGHDWQPCPRGTYSPVEFLSREEQCKPCEPGHYCAFINATSTTGQCDAGFFCHNGSDQRQPSGGNRGYAGICPSGHYCSKGDPLAPVACPAGHYNNRTHADALEDCRKCPGGQYCEEDGLTWPSGPCDAGYYCIEGAVYRNPDNNSDTGGPCPPGHFCPEGSPSPYACPGGKYNSQWKQSQCRDCPPGYFCPNASTNFTECHEGFFCPNGSASAIPCPKGSYKNYTLGDKLEDCKMCPVGMYCEFSGMPQPSGLCAGGWYCTGGSWERMPLNISDIANGTAVCPLIGEIGGFCKKGSFCPAGSHEPYPCTPGYYCEQDKLDRESGHCAAGYFCNGSTVYSHPVNQTNGDRCPKGHYCPSKSSYPSPCPPGTYADTEYNQFKNNCKPCIPGKFCPTYGLDYPAGNCSEGFYCPGGETQQSPPDKECRPGHFCPEGSGLHNPCPAGTYQPYARKGFCYICPTGSYCDPNEVRQNMSCEGNVSCGVIVPSNCLAGYFCPNGTKWARQYPCPVGTFGNVTNLMAEDQCTQCTKGYYCGTSGITQPTEECHAGYYCIEGASVPTPNDTVTGAPCPAGSFCIRGSHRPEPCPVGTFGPSKALQSRSGCVDCEGGKYCNYEGLAGPNGSCDPGYFCEIRAVRPNPVNASHGGGVCPRGHYCPRETTTPFKCPPGTFNNETRATEPSDCTPCTPGQFCEGYGNTYPDGLCDEGWYCEKAAYSRRPVPKVNITFNNSVDFTCPLYSVNFTGGICPLGHFCPQGSSEPKQCLRGSYCGQLGLASPEGNCTAGYYCSGGDIIPNPRNCTAGYYCPEGTEREVPCPVGTFSPYAGKSKEQDCLNCTAGFYCPLPGKTEVLFQCLQGYYCPSGSKHNSTVICPRGSSCPTGSGQPQNCVPGKYQDQEGQYECNVCLAGYYCDPSTNLTGVIYPTKCTAGNYCPSGTKTEKQFPCPAGTYSNDTGLERSSDCKLCPPKMFCASPGLTKPSGTCAAGVSYVVFLFIERTYLATGRDLCCMAEWQKMFLSSLFSLIKPHHM